MSRILGVLPALLLAACFDPSFNNPTCGPAGECPDGYECMAGVCRLPVVVVPDADPNAPDASLIDADPNAPDAFVPTDAPILAGCAGWTFTPSNVPCSDPVGTWDLTTSTSYNTDTGTVSTGAAPISSMVSQTGGGSVRVVSVTSFSVGAGASLRITGSLPLVVLVHGTALVGGSIDASADLDVPGAGGNANACGTQLGNGTAGMVGGNTGGGGGGGSFGGSGRNGANGSSAGAVAGGNGNMSTTLTLAPLRGGCRGGVGGSGLGGGGTEGAGGGAVQIVARDQITVTGTVHAGGGGGAGAPRGAVGGGGGAGGGSGGGVLLEAPAVSIMGGVCANSGAGGGGASQAAFGVNGQDASCTGPAVGGSGGAGGGDGGNGTHLTTPPGNGTALGACVIDCGGGGGGGGAGVIRVRGSLTSTGATISPDATNVPL